MKKQITRRDFLKLSGLLPLSVVAPRFVTSLNAQQKQQNVLIIVFDAWSAKHISLYGYQRETTPNLARLAEKAIVYHNHYAGGMYTIPGTASLLTGLLPWTHRAFPQGSTVDSEFASNNIFNLFPNHYRLAYSHNTWVYTFLNQFRKSLDKYIPLEEYLLERDVFIPRVFRYDSDIATVAWKRIIQTRDDGYSYSLFLPNAYEKYSVEGISKSEQIKNQFPRGITKNGHYPFILEHAIDSLGESLPTTKSPFLGYFHFYPPHDPYNTRQEFFGRFEDDGFVPVEKPIDLFQDYDDSKPLTDVRRTYDEFILYVDQEFGKLYNYLEKSGVLDNTWLILTSDHGEMFERGILQHTAPVLYEPVIHVPLMIFEPGRQNRDDVRVPTSAIDLLPTLLHITGQRVPDQIEGVLLPPFSKTYSQADRNIYVVEARRNPKYAPLNTSTTVLIKENYKLMYFTGYEELGDEERIELYDLQNDPEELNDLSTSKRETNAEMLNELKQKLAKVDEPYL